MPTNTVKARVSKNIIMPSVLIIFELVFNRLKLKIIERIVKEMASKYRII